MNHSLSVIGTIEAVDLPDYGVNGVLAKVDTGADSSAIWASNVSEHQGELYFSLFGARSPHFNGEVIKTRRFSKVIVQNSFGQKEERYKIYLKLRLDNRVIRARFTLANRSNHRFPVLIGRRTIRGKFVVDSARHNPSLGNHKVLMLLNSKSSRNADFAASIKTKGVGVDRTTYGELVFNCGGEGNRIVIAPTATEIADYGLVYFHTSNIQGHPYVAAAIAQYLSARNVDFVDQIVGQLPTPNKLYQYMVLTDNMIPVPPTVFMLPQRLAESYEYLVSELGIPFILKDTAASHGDNNFLINSKAEFERTLRQAIDMGVWMTAQQYIPNDCDFRLIVLGGQVHLAIKRARRDSSTHLNNVSRGSKAELVDLSNLPSALINQAVLAVKLLRLQIAGVDLIQDKNTKLWYCLEVNKSPQIYSGSFIPQKRAAMASYFGQRLLN